MATREERPSDPHEPSRVSAFKIAAAQVASIRGDIDANIAAHAAAIEAAAKHEVSALVFPELSLTGYEPDLAAELAMLPTDRRLECLLVLARQHHMKVVVGAPLSEWNCEAGAGRDRDRCGRQYDKLSQDASRVAGTGALCGR